jgi:hypothetical protein
MNTVIIFADGKDLIVHHAYPFSMRELKELEKLTSDQFIKMIMGTGRFEQVPYEENPFLNGMTDH